MKSNFDVGFTIIETMLFLGITGLLVMGILVGAGTSINIQRYHDSVTSLQSVLQQQFSEVANVNNQSDGSLICYGDGSVSPRGQSDCIILGRYITSISGQSLSIKSVIGYMPLVTTSQNDVETLKQYDVQVSPVAGETYDVEWGASLVQPTNGNDKSFSVLILRSPLSGIVRTFINPDSIINDAEISSLIDEANLSQSVLMCIDSNGMFSGGKSAVRINPNTTNAGGVETLGEALSGC